MLLGISKINLCSERVLEGIPTSSLTVRPWKYTGPQKERIVFQPQFFRGELLNFRGIPASSKWPFDSPNGGHVFSPEKVTKMGPFTRSRLEEPGNWLLDWKSNSSNHLFPSFPKPTMNQCPIGKTTCFSSWWFQPIWKILVKMGIFPK